MEKGEAWFFFFFTQVEAQEVKWKHGSYEETRSITQQHPSKKQKPHPNRAIQKENLIKDYLQRYQQGGETTGHLCTQGQGCTCEPREGAT